LVELVRLEVTLWVTPLLSNKRVQGPIGADLIVTYHSDLAQCEILSLPLYECWELRQHSSSRHGPMPGGAVVAKTVCNMTLWKIVTVSQSWPPYFADIMANKSCCQI
jgi:hypothetical protein